MKKALLLILSVLVLIGLVFAASEDNQGVPSLLSQIKEVLINILEKLNIIAEKNMTAEVIVEPNITVEILEIVVNPNITLPDKECKWENLNQEVEIEIFDPAPPDAQKKIFTLPKNILYKEINITRVVGLIKCGSAIKCEYLLNGGVCYTEYVASNDYKVVDFCTHLFKEGTNEVSTKYYMHPGVIHNSTLYKLYIEMEVKPANC